MSGGRRVAAAARHVHLALPLLLVAALLAACSTPPKSHWLPDVEPAPRPRDPWVLRCVLDKHPRMLVVALDKDLWAAYDTQSCTLSRTWRGDVSFDGPVYTTVHGPQPTTRGDDLLDPAAGMVWSTERDDLKLASGGEPLPPIFHGYRFVDGHVQLLYALMAPDAAAVNITETIEVTHPRRGAVEFVRQFDFDRWPEGWTPQLSRLEARWEPPGSATTHVTYDGLRFGSFSDSEVPAANRLFIEFTAPTATLHVTHDIDSAVGPGDDPATDGTMEAGR